MTTPIKGLRITLYPIGPGKPKHQMKKCICGKVAKEHFDNGLSCGDDMCDEYGDKN